MTLFVTDYYLHITVNSRLELIDAHGEILRPRAVVEIVDRRLCMVARWLKSHGELHKVVFRCGNVCWVHSSDCTWFDVNNIPA